MNCMNSRAMDVSFDCTDGVVTTNHVTSGQPMARHESAAGAAGRSDMQHGMSSRKGMKRKLETRRGCQNKVYVAAEVWKGEDAPQARWGGYGLYKEFIALHFWDRKWFYYMGFSPDDANTLLYFGYTPKRNDCQQEYGFPERYNSGRPESYYLWCLDELK